jgi:hypothetical protein
MTKPVTPQDMFDLWQKMVNPGAYPLQSLMFPVLDARELEKKVAELQAVEHWLKANLNMLQLSIKSLEYQRAMLKGGEKFQQALREGKHAQAAAAPGSAPEPSPNPAMWAWDMMAKAGQDAMEQAGAAAPAVPRTKRKRAKRHP